MTFATKDFTRQIHFRGILPRGVHFNGMRCLFLRLMINWLLRAVNCYVLAIQNWKDNNKKDEKIPLMLYCQISITSNKGDLLYLLPCHAVSNSVSVADGMYSARTPQWRVYLWAVFSSVSAPLHVCQKCTALTVHPAFERPPQILTPHNPLALWSLFHSNVFAVDWWDAHDTPTRHVSGCGVCVCVRVWVGGWTGVTCVCICVCVPVCVCVCMSGSVSLCIYLC